MPWTTKGSQIETGTKVVTLSSGSAGAAAVTFQKVFTQAPEVFVVHHLGDESATLTVSSEATTGFSVAVSGSGIPDGDVTLEWVAHEKT